MVFYIKTLIPATIAVLLLLATATTANSQTTSFVYDFSGDQPTTLTYQGDAHFPPNSTFLRLINTDSSGDALPLRTGRVLYSEPVTLWQPHPDSWWIPIKVSDLETTIKFIIKPNPNDNRPPADGLVFFIAPVGETIPVGSGGGSFGVFNWNGNRNSIFAVEFDIFTNWWDPPSPHVGIDYETNRSVNFTEVSSELIGKEVTMRVNYAGASSKTTVVVTASDGGDRYEVSYETSLSLFMPEQVQFGIAATTGLNVATYDVVSWFLTSTLFSLNGEAIRQVVEN